MTENVSGQDLFLLQSLLVRKNREFTEGMRTGKKHHELLQLYNEIKNIYDLIFQQRQLISSDALTA
jgi:hypothetical protein